jgi:hypothetical protein
MSIHSLHHWYDVCKACRPENSSAMPYDCYVVLLIMPWRFSNPNPSRIPFKSCGAEWTAQPVESYSSQSGSIDALAELRRAECNSQGTLIAQANVQCTQALYPQALSLRDRSCLGTGNFCVPSRTTNALDS